MPMNGSTTRRVYAMLTLGYQWFSVTRKLGLSVDELKMYIHHGANQLRTPRRDTWSAR
jgi:hypothetical protein